MVIQNLKKGPSNEEEYPAPRMFSMVNSLYFGLLFLTVSLLTGVFGVDGGIPFITMVLVDCAVLMSLIGMKYRFLGKWGE